MAFHQVPPELGNQYEDDPLLVEYVARVLPDARAAVEDEYRELGELSGGALYRAQLADLANEPVHIPWDPWGHRVDRIEVTDVWKRAQIIAAEHGLVAAAYEGTWGPLDRVHQFIMNYLVGPSADVYTCPLAMTDGAARTLLDSGNAALIDHAVPRLTSRDPAQMWTSGQWMTERTGGSDVGLSETVARRAGSADSADSADWRLYGTKWFTSATTAEIALTLARPDGNGPGGRGLALFYIELRDPDGRMRNIRVNRLKDKLGTRKVPTAELTLDGTPAIPVVGLDRGVRHIAPMLHVTRTWNAVIAAAGMRRGLALAKDYARHRRAFGAPLAQKPLHIDTLAGVQAEAEGAFLLSMRAAELLGRCDAGFATEAEKLAQRVVNPIAKLTTGKQGVAVASEVLEAFGGAGYVEDTGLPRLLADAQVLPIWEGTTNVLSLDTLRALAADGAFEAVGAEIRGHLGRVKDPSLARCRRRASDALTRAGDWLARAMATAANAKADSGRAALESGARRFAMTLGRTLELSLLTAHAQWCLDHDRGPRAAAAARRFAAHGVDRLPDPDDAATLADDAALLMER